MFQVVFTLRGIDEPNTKPILFDTSVWIVIRSTSKSDYDHAAQSQKPSSKLQSTYVIILKGELAHDILQACLCHAQSKIYKKRI